MAIMPGVFKVEFSTWRGAGSGVVVIENGKVRGGDGAMLYRGTYKEIGDDFEADIAVTRHTTDISLDSVFGIDVAHLKLRGRSASTRAHMAGRAKEAPGVPLTAILERLDS